MTADQWESQVMHAANYCKAKGYKLAAVIYFSHIVFPNWKAFDGTTPEVAERMPVVNARLRQMFGGGANRSAGWAAILLILSRAATRAEKLFANVVGGTGAAQAIGSTGPATMVFEGPIGPADVLNARNS
jgi:hypothetical protein